jgi:hypothetical protein
MTTPQVSPADATPDYSKVRGWLLVFALYAGYSFIDGIASTFFMSDAQRDLSQRLDVLAPGLFVVSSYVNGLMLLVHLAQCIAIFLRLRVGRLLSLVAFGWNILFTVAMLPFFGALIEATKPQVSKGLSVMVTATAYFSVAVSLALSVASFLYFLRSERVKKTLVN